MQQTKNYFYQKKTTQQTSQGGFLLYEIVVHPSGVIQVAHGLVPHSLQLHHPGRRREVLLQLYYALVRHVEPGYVQSCRAQLLHYQPHLVVVVKEGVRGLLDNLVFVLCLLYCKKLKMFLIFFVVMFKRFFAECF